MKFEIHEVSTRLVLDRDAICTPYMLADWPGRTGYAVKRNGFWNAIDYPGFQVYRGETVRHIRIVETLDDIPF